MNTLTKKCTGPCDKVLDIMYFNLDKNGKYGRTAKCKECRHKSRLAAREETRIYNKKYNEDNINKIRELKKQYRKDNKEIIKESRHQYYLENKEIENTKSRQWKMGNKEKVKEQKREWNNEKYNVDINHKLRVVLRNRLNDAIGSNIKNGSAVQDLGCSINELKQYLEKQFYSNPETGEQMTWENHGLYGWHIDHIIPLASFDLTNRYQFLNACRYTNLQPLWAKDNLKKGDRII